jgi:vacuolar-type H+-ATPase subunit B/Vma2
VGESGLGAADRRALAFAERFEEAFVGQGQRRRGLAETIAAGWRLLEDLPREDLVRIRDSTWATRPDAARETP